MEAQTNTTDNKYAVKKKITPKTKQELLELNKEELIDIILRLERHNTQLKNILAKRNEMDGQVRVVSTPCVSNNKDRTFDFNKCPTRRVLLKVCYFGWSYSGLAVQENTCSTIEHHLFAALTRSCIIQCRQTSQYHRCGRTDKCVSSFGQVISLRVRSKLEPESQGDVASELDYCKILNRLLPEDIRVLAWMPAPDDKPEFSARFDCVSRTYKYYMPRGDLNLQAMCEACQHLIGSHDFRNLCKMDVGNGVTSYIRRISSADVCTEVHSADTDPGYSMFYIKIVGNAFLWHQIRCIVAVLLLVGQGLETPDVVKELLDHENCPRKPQYGMAADYPLNLFECRYGDADELWIYDRDEVADIVSRMQAQWTSYQIKATMIRDCVGALESTLDGANVSRQYHRLLEGGARVHIPLLVREKCMSLDEKIVHFAKKKRIVKVD